MCKIFVDFTSPIVATLGEYEQKQIREAMALAAEVSAYLRAECKLEIEMEDGKQVFRRAVVFLDLAMRITVSYAHKSGYKIFCESLHDFKNVCYYQHARLVPGLVEPNKIGTLSVKKLEEWMQYYRKLYTSCFEEDRANQTIKDMFTRQVSGLNVEWDTDKEGGKIRRNGIEFKFKFQTTYISTTIDLYASGSSLETFMKLSENRFVG